MKVPEDVPGYRRPKGELGPVSISLITPGGAPPLLRMRQDLQYVTVNIPMLRDLLGTLRRCLIELHGTVSGEVTDSHGHRNVSSPMPFGEDIHYTMAGCEFWEPCNTCPFSDCGLALGTTRIRRELAVITFVKNYSG